MADKTPGSPARKPISKKLRFEIFKRDSFTCQYCGQKAPDVILHVDHIDPVKHGGKNDILNLITSCKDCNLGKKARKLSDHTVLQKQRLQLEEVNERRNQIEMMVQWRDYLGSLEEASMRMLESEIQQYSEFKLNDNGCTKLKRLLKRYSVEEILAAIQKAFPQYLRFDSSGKTYQDSWERAFAAIPKIIEVDRNGGLPEHILRILYARAILRNRFPGKVYPRVILKMMQAMVESSTFDVEMIVDMAKNVSSYDEFVSYMTPSEAQP